MNICSSYDTEVSFSCGDDLSWCEDVDTPLITRHCAVVAFDASRPVLLTGPGVSAETPLMSVSRAYANVA